MTKLDDLFGDEGHLDRETFGNQYGIDMGLTPGEEDSLDPETLTGMVEDSNLETYLSTLGDDPRKNRDLDAELAALRSEIDAFAETIVLPDDFQGEGEDELLDPVEFDGTIPDGDFYLVEEDD